MDRRGFTLVEMAIVLTIIGLVAGGVLLGKNMLRSARISQMFSQLAKYEGAYNQFKTQYGGPPGDIVDATSYWGTDAVTGGCNAPAPVAADMVPKKATCNGNGDGWIDGNLIEDLRGWQHLANAGLIDGSYDGVPHGSTYQVPGENMPEGRIANTSYRMFAYGPVSAGDTCWYLERRSNLIGFGTKDVSWYYGATLTPRELYNADIKLDDGKPGLGIVNSLGHAAGCNPNCTTNVASHASATYNLSIKGVACTVIYVVEQ